MNHFQIYNDGPLIQNQNNNTEQLPSTNGDQAEMQENLKQICRVLYDFNATSEDELDVRAGDCVIVESQLGSDWLIGHIISDLTNGSNISKTGRFPASYVT